jgi:transposase
VGKVVSELGATRFVGIDWAAEHHTVSVLDESGRAVATFTIAHSRDGFDKLVKRLAALGPVDTVPVAVERPDGRLVDRLLEAGHPVVRVSPKAIKAWREAEVASGAKSDSADAAVIAEYLRLRQRRLSILEPFSEATRALRAVVRARDDLVHHRVAAANQLEACLDAYWPGAKQLFCDITSNIALAFLEDYPTPAAGARIGEGRMAAFLKRHGYSGRRSSAELVERLRGAPAGIATRPEAEARRASVAGYVAVVRALNQSIKELERAIAGQLGEHPDALIFTSLPRSGRLNAAQMLAEWGDSRQAYDGPDAVAALAGATPVTKASGKHREVQFRWACNKRLRNAITTFAGNSRHSSPWAASIYDRAIARGCDHPHAVRVLARAWIRVIYRCWIDGIAYDPARHGAAITLMRNVAEVPIEKSAA